MIAHLFNAPIKEDETAVGVGTVGSSEAIMLAGLASKRKWQTRGRNRGNHVTNPTLSLVLMFRYFVCVKLPDKVIRLQPP